MVTVLQRQSLVSWDEQTRDPNIIISDWIGEVHLSYQDAKKVVRDLQETLDRIDEEREWL